MKTNSKLKPTTKWGPNRGSGESKADWGENTKWVWFDPPDLQRFARQPRR